MNSKAVEISKVIRQEIVNSIQPYSRRRVALALSGGVDSCSLLAAMRVVRCRPIIVSYTPQGRKSTDFLMAQRMAEKFGLTFVPVFVSLEPHELELRARHIISMGYDHKVGVECLTPLYDITRAARDAGAKVMFTGDQADGFFINGRWASVDFNRAAKIPRSEWTSLKADNDPNRIDSIRRHYWNIDRSCSEGVRELGRQIGLSVVVPYRNKVIRDAFTGSTWWQVNKPRMKEPIRLAFEEELRVIPTRPSPVNLHKGDSQFGTMMGKVLMAQPHLRGEWRSPTGLYTAMARGEV